MIYLILGMHKSGTTLVARALHESGITMIPDAPKGDYPREKYEWRDFKFINHALLGSRPDDSLGVPLGQPLNDSPALAVQAERLIEAGDSFTDWGFKDPRTTLTYNWWRKRLPPHKVIAMTRPAMEVVEHYRRQHDDPVKARLHWGYYNAQGMALVPDECLTLSYPALFDGDHEWRRLCDFVGRDLPDVRDPVLYHCRAFSWQ